VLIGNVLVEQRNCLIRFNTLWRTPKINLHRQVNDVLNSLPTMRMSLVVVSRTH
jgi:hypothetical protein